MHIRKILLGTVAAAAMSVSAHAAPINGTGAVSLLGISNTPAGTIGTGTTFTIAAALFSSGTGDLAGILVATPLTVSPITGTTPAAFTFTSSFGSFAGISGVATASGPVASRIVDIYVLGTFTPAGPLSPTFAAAPMSLTFSFTQTGGATGAVSGSFSMASPPAPPPPGVPAPAALALFGIALAGLGVAARARKA